MDITANSLENVIRYMEMKNLFNLGYNKYGFFKNVIRFVLNNNDHEFCRCVFQKLLNKKVFQKSKRGRVTRYIFNTGNKPVDGLTFWI